MALEMASHGLDTRGYEASISVKQALYQLRELHCPVKRFNYCHVAHATRKFINVYHIAVSELWNRASILTEASQLTWVTNPQPLLSKRGSLPVQAGSLSPLLCSYALLASAHTMHSFVSHSYKEGCQTRKNMEKNTTGLYPGSLHIPSQSNEPL